ncbi:hypothetical protein PHMEG_00010065 [Phytophthora megakarya]|uniref:Uncharacterized protein n=1 Tax=Phytophthora megakarya TaxID=4795 RepID=A0A225WEM7_9STRA|nr:hypothetical protein PHMEG_00010065 [Phytophthora megakarya]
MLKGQERPAFKYEDLLVTNCVVPRPMDDKDTEKMRNYDWQIVVLSDQDCYIRSLLSQTLPRGYLESLSTSFNEEDLSVARKRLEAQYEQSNAQGMAALVAEFDKAMEMDFSTVGQLIVRVKETRNRINRQSRENLKGVTMIPNQYAAIKVLSLFPSQYCKNNVDYTSEGFHLDKVEALLRNVFMDKSKSQIQAMQARIVPANYKGQLPEDEKGPQHRVGGKKGPKKKAKPMREEIPAAVSLMQPISKVEVAAVVKGTPQEPEPGYGTTLTSEQAQQDADELMTSPPPSPTPSSSSSAMSDDENDMNECEQGYFPSHSMKLSKASSKIKEASMDIESTLDAVTALIKLLKEAGMIPGSFETDDLFGLDLTVIQPTSRDLFGKLKILVCEVPQIADPVSPPAIDTVDNLTVRGNAGGEIQDPASKPNQIWQWKLFNAEMDRFLAEQQAAGVDPVVTEHQNSGSRDVEMESIRSSDRGSNWEYDPDDIDFPAPAKAALTTAASGSTGPTMIKRVRISAISDLKEFTGKGQDEDRVRA